MRVTIISETIQEFQGVRYYLCGNYFQRDGERLHRAVWSAFHGRPVPDGHHVHHRDEDRSNNQPHNLELLRSGDHMAHHHAGHGRGIPPQATEAAKAWHGSPEGRQWHREHYRNVSERLHVDVELTCEQCGSSYVGRDNGANRFCSNACKSAWRRDSGADDEVRACESCGATFRVNKYRKKRTCSRSCARSLRRG